MRYLLRKNRIWIALALAALLLAGCGNSAAPAPTATPEPTPTPTAAPTPSPTPAPTPEPTAEPTKSPATPSDLPVPPASPTDIAVTPTPAPTPTRVDDSFFADAAFLGNSLMEGLRFFGGLSYGDFYCGTSASVVSVSSVRDYRDGDGAASTMLDALLEKQYGKIFVLFGINELGFHIDGFTGIYAELLDALAAGEPDAEIYILSLTPITEARSKSSDMFTGERVLEFNQAIAALAAEHGCIYMDLYKALADENGWLPEKDSTDGIHFTGAKYAEWAEFLRTYPYASAGQG